MAQTGERLFRTDIEHNIKIDLYKPSDWDSIKVRFHNSVTLFGFIFGSKNLRQQYVSCMCGVMNKIESAIPPIELKYHADFSAYKDYVSSSIFARTIEIADAGYHCSSATLSNGAESQLLMHISRNSLLVESPKQMSVHLEIFSMSGQIVYQQEWKPAENNTGTANLEFLKAGMYVARLRNDQAVFSLKIVISGR